MHSFLPGHPFDLHGAELRVGEHQRIDQEMVEPATTAAQHYEIGSAADERGQESELEVGVILVVGMYFGLGVRMTGLLTDRVEITDDEVDRKLQGCGVVEAGVGGDHQIE
jgi:hypothetical protein